MDKITCFTWVAVTLLAGQIVTAQFVEEPSSVSEVEGGMVLLKCMLDPNYAPGSTVYVKWYRGGIGFVPNDQQRYEYEDIANTNGNYNLIINNLNFREDNAEFLCESRVVEGNDVKSRSADVSVLVPPEKVFISQNGAVVPSGGTVSFSADDMQSFSCTAENSNPGAAITWMLGENDISSSATEEQVPGSDASKVTTVSRLERTFDVSENAKLLKCNVFLHDKVNVTGSQVTFDIQFMSTSGDITILAGGSALVEGDELYLRCGVEGNPQPAYKWFKDNQPISTSREFQKTVTIEDAGVYKCEASNAYGAGKSNTLTISVSAKSSTAAAVAIPIVVAFIVLAIVVGVAYYRKMCCFKRGTSNGDEEGGASNAGLDAKTPDRVPTPETKFMADETPAEEERSVKPEKAKKPKHPLAQEYEAVYNVKQSNHDEPSDRNVEGLTYADLDLTKGTEGAVPARKGEETVYSEVKPNTAV
ncbi:PREDICTED: synaptogenesis protein syg-2-like [Priapulus caudatus]|uniref:Synaptogenesis protein syg-2-like n=1 Tax=Priapulus caudatus TaxID=37621 RepID=A0ABM1E999_PRICU|nr:PREDICTED: synaptogenesis protein syg-2-like [Priapulus caudatus]XP_014668770.1 PREDICTED: synaptogenesis protein syg-2-like [Priapulus caudatus]XP_014668772.1 PREDICTED: synaptogenesis protein syg-2-like [Priapulus caudatus]